MNFNGVRTLLTLLSLLGICSDVAAQSPVTAEARFRTSVQVTAIEITVKVTDDSGKTPGDLVPGDFTVLEDGKPRPVIGVENLRAAVVSAGETIARGSTPKENEQPGWEIVIFFDQTLSSLPSIRGSAKKLAEEAGQLVAAGSVAIVSSDPSPKTILAPTRDALVLAAALKQIAEHPNARGEIERLRRTYVSEIDQNADDQSARSAPADSKGLDLKREMTVRRAVAEEYRIITRQRDKLTRWLSDYPKGDRPRALLLVADGFDLDPREFYVTGLVSDSSVNEMRSELQSYDSSGGTQSLARLLASGGWTSISVSPGYMSASMTDASEEGSSKASDFLTGTSSMNSDPVTLFSHPLEPMRLYADATGGTVLTDPNKLAGLSDELAKRVRITYQVSRVSAGEVHKIQVKSNRPGLHVAAPQWSGEASTEDVSTSRVRSVLAGDAAKGDLPVRCETVATDAASSARKKSTTLRAIVDFSPLASLREELRATTVRVSVAVDIPSALPSVTHQLTKNVDLSSQTTFVYEAPVNYREGSSSASIVVEELGTGAWGGCTTSLDGQNPVSAISSEPASGTGQTAPAATPRDNAWIEAFARARAEGKLVFVSYPLDAAVTSSRILEMRAKTLADPAVRRRLTMFVYLDDPAILTTQTADKAVTFAVFDPLQNPIASWFDMVNPEGMVERLDAILRGAGEFVNAATLLSAGKKAEADLARGVAYNHAGRAAEARIVLAQGRALAVGDNNNSLAQRIDLQVAWSWVLQGDLSKAMAILDEIRRAPDNADISAAASFTTGRIRAQSGDVKGARDAFRAAATLAPADSDLHRMAVEGYRGAGGSEDLPGSLHIDSDAIVIVPPPRPILSGRTTFRTIVNSLEVKRVEFLLDGTAVADRKEPPFEARIDLGSTPRRRSLEVIAFGPDGNRIGADQLDVNSPPGNFAVHILSPGSSSASGRVPFEATATPPAEHRVVRMEVYWNDSLVARMAAQPFRKSLDIANLSSGGYLRAVAWLDDGRSAEDIRALNLAGTSESMDVRLVELFLTIDSPPASVASLTKSDFRILEDGVPQEVVSFLPAGAIPLTLGVAIDSSGSMKNRLATAQEAAARFIENSVADGDQAFLIDFDSQPRLLQSTTGDVQQLTRAILQVQAGGGTALYDTIMFGLLQLQGAGGRRALVVLTDGADESSTYGLKSVERMAARTNIPIYILLLGDRGPVPTGINVTNRGFAIAEGDSNRRQLQNLVDASGGKIFGIDNVGEAARIYGVIRSELAGQHLLTYRSKSQKPESEWRKVDVKALRPDVKVRTISGYYPSD